MKEMEEQEELVECENDPSSFQFVNIAKYDLKNKFWVPIDPLDIGDTNFGSVLSLAVAYYDDETVLFAGGVFLNAGGVSVTKKKIYNIFYFYFHFYFFILQK